MASWKYEKTATLGTVELDSGYTAASGTMVLVAGQGARLPSAGDFWLAWSTDYTDPFATIHLFKVTARSTDTLTVTAETTEGGGDTNINAGQKLKAVMSISALDQLRQDISQTGAYSSAATAKAGALYLPSDYGVLLRDSGSAMAPWGPIFPLTLPPVASNWTVAGGSSPTLTDAGPTVVITSVGAGVTDSLCVAKKTAPSTPYVIDATLSLMSNNMEAPNGSTALVVGWTDGTKLATFAFYPVFSGGVVASQKWNTVTGFSASYTTGIASLSWGAPLRMRFADDGANRICTMVALNGVSTITFHTVGRTDFLTPTDVFWGVANRSASAAGTVMGILHSWKQT